MFIFLPETNFYGTSFPSLISPHPRFVPNMFQETNVFGFKGPRKMAIIIPGLFENGGRKELRPISDKDSILERYKTHRMEEMILLNNKQPQWNEDTQSYVLNFHGRVTQASVKNFQIVHNLNREWRCPPLASLQPTMWSCSSAASTPRYSPWTSATRSARCRPSASP